MEEIYIKVWATEQGDGDEGGYMYSIHDHDNDDDDIDGLDGGLCTGSIKDAILMAATQAVDLVKIIEKSRAIKK